MLLKSNGKNLSALFALAVLTLALIFQSFWSWQGNVPVKNDSGVFNYPLPFLPETMDEVVYKESESWTAFFPKYIQTRLNRVLQSLFSEYHAVEFLNAREADIDYHVNGFSLVESPMEECDWTVKENREKFYREMEPIIRELHPDSDELVWYDDGFLQRSFDGSNEPAIDGPHLDYHVDHSLTKEWAGYDLSEIDMIIGIWKPDNMDTPVVDYPLALMDASTFEPTDSRPFKLEFTNTLMNNTVQELRVVSGSPRYRPEQKWYYYPEQTSNEILLFRQYTNEDTVGSFANFHTSFKVPGFPSDAPSRRSVEMRVGLTFKKDEAKTSS